MKNVRVYINGSKLYEHFMSESTNLIKWSTIKSKVNFALTKNDTKHKKNGHIYLDYDTLNDLFTKHNTDQDVVDEINSMNNNNVSYNDDCKSNIQNVTYYLAYKPTENKNYEWSIYPSDQMPTINSPLKFISTVTNEYVTFRTYTEYCNSLNSFQINDPIRNRFSHIYYCQVSAETINKVKLLLNLCDNVSDFYKIDAIMTEFGLKNNS